MNVELEHYVSVMDMKEYDTEWSVHLLRPMLKRLFLLQGKP